MSKISIFKLVSVAEETALNLTLSETPKTGFVTSRPIWALLQENQSLGFLTRSCSDQLAELQRLAKIMKF